MPSGSQTLSLPGEGSPLTRLRHALWKGKAELALIGVIVLIGTTA